MKFSANREEFLHALQIVNRGISSQVTLPILEHALIKAKDGRLQISAHNLELAIVTNCPAQVSNEGAVTVPAKTLLQWINLASGQEVRVSKTENEEIKVICDQAETMLKGMSASEYPDIPPVEKQDSVKLNQKDFKKALDKVVFAAASSGTRPVLSGILFSSSGDQLTLVGTDSYRLSEHKVKLSTAATEKINCIVPAKTLHELGRVLEAGDKSELEIIFSQNQILFRFDGIELSSRLIDGQFPNYEQIIPKQAQTEVIVSRQELMQTIKRVAIFARENNNNIKFFLSSNTLRITTDATELGSEDSSISVNSSNGVDVQIALNATFVIDILLALSDKEITLKFGERLQPILITEEGTKDFCHIIMPLKV